MSGSRIKGITIEIGGDTTGLNDALKETDRQISSTQSALRDVNRLLKFDPKNTHLLEQKQKLLAEAISDTETKMQALKDADKQAKVQLEKGDLGQDKYDALQREISETEQRLKSLKEQADDSVKNISNKFSELGDRAKSASKSVAPLSKAATGLMTAAIATVPATAELREDLSRLDNNARDAGVGIDQTREAFEAFNVISGEVDSSVEATSNLLQAGFTESNLQKAVEGLTGAYLKFPDTLKIESLADSLQETLATGKSTGQFAELLDRLGMSTEAFDEKLQSMTTDTEKQNFALETLASAGLNDTYNEYLKNNEALVESKQANYEFQESLAGLAETIAPIITNLTELATRLINWFNDLSPTVKMIIGIVVGFIAGLAPILSFVGSISTAISVLIPIIGGLNISILPVIATIGVVIGVIVAVIAIVKNWGKITIWISEKFTELASKIKDKAKEIGSSVKDGINTAIEFLIGLKDKAIEWGKDFIQGLIDGIKSKISGIIDTVKGVADTIASYLHFSRPDVGPLHYYEQWMPDFMDGLAKGIYANIPKISKAAESVASTLSNNAIKNPASSGIDPDAIYGAVRSGARDGSPQYTIIDERSFKRGLIGMGVVMQ